MVVLARNECKRSSDKTDCTCFDGTIQVSKCSVGFKSGCCFQSKWLWYSVVLSIVCSGALIVTQPCRILGGAPKNKHLLWRDGAPTRRNEANEWFLSNKTRRMSECPLIGLSGVCYTVNNKKTVARSDDAWCVDGIGWSLVEAIVGERTEGQTVCPVWKKVPAQNFQD